MKRLTVAAAMVAVLSGCGLARQQQSDELRAKSKVAIDECDATYPTRTPKTAVAYAKCTGDALEVSRTTVPYPDLVDLLVAKQIAIAEQVEQGKLTMAQGDEATAKARSDTVAEEQRRTVAASPAGSAADNIGPALQRAGAALQAAAPPPPTSSPSPALPAAAIPPRITCTTFGNRTVCQ